jgi:hypothetical protein
LLLSMNKEISLLIYSGVVEDLLAILKWATFFTQKSGTFEPVVWCGWAPFIKWSLLNRLSSWPSLDFGSWILCCWRCQEGICTWISRYFSPKMIHFPFLMFLRFKRLYLTSLGELRNWGLFGGSIDSLNYSCIFQ